MADIVYTYGNSVYMNITNKCPCSCVFASGATATDSARPNRFG